jgi:hypothetical protein
MVRSQKELIAISLQNITEASIRITAVKETLREAGLYNFCSAFARINDDISIQAKDLNDLNK